MHDQNAGGAGASGGRGSFGAAQIRSKQALIIAASPISRIVIGRTIERIYLSSQAVTPEAAPAALRKSQPLLVIIDGPLGEPAAEQLFTELARHRKASEQKLPRVLMIADAAASSDLPYGTTIDATVSKPITPDTLQPVVERLLGE